MKKLLLILSLSTLLFSCNDWLDLDSKTEITQDDLFSGRDGFHTALNGIYRLMGSNELYGGELNCGMVSILANNYNIDYLDYYYKFLAKGEYETGFSHFITDPVWEKGFNVIANCNNLIAHTEQKDSSFFERKDLEKKMILAEARGLRALMHFDLLRLFAPAPVVADKDKTYMPYHTTYPVEDTKYLTVDAVLDSVIMDLEFAAQNLESLDKSEEMAAIWKDEYERVESIRPHTFFECRGTRMNYFGAKALLARVYLYKGDKKNAYNCAHEVYQFAKEGAEHRWFTFTKENDLNTDEGFQFSKMYNDLILSMFNMNLWDMYEMHYTNNGKNNRLIYSNTEELFSGDKDDYRLYLMNKDGATMRWVRPHGETIRGSVELQGRLAPVIRATEIYYIMSECLADKNLPEAVKLLEEVRIGRGCKTLLPSSVKKDKEAFMNALCTDMTREFMSEAQAFYMYKRLNRPVFNGKHPLDMSKRFVLPYPSSEIKY